MSGSSRSPSPGLGMLGTLGRSCYRHRWLTLVGWLLGVACLITLWTQFGAPSQDNFTGSDPGQTLLNQHFHQQSGDTPDAGHPVRRAGPVPGRPGPGGAARWPPFARAAHVTAVGSPYQDTGQISPDGHIAFATIQFGVPSHQHQQRRGAVADARRPGGVRARGAPSPWAATWWTWPRRPYGGPTEGVGVAAAAVVLLIAFGSLLAMGLPVLTAVLGIGAGLSLIALLGHIFPAPSFSPIVAAMIGLGVGVDYALFIVTRFREALRERLAAGSATASEEAAVIAMRTAGRTVLIAGSTVVIGMLGLFVLRQPLLNGVAVAAAATVAMVLLGSLTLLPALLGFTGTRLARPSRVRPPRWLRRRSRPEGSAVPAEHFPGHGRRPAGVSRGASDPGGFRGVASPGPAERPAGVSRGASDPGGFRGVASPGPAERPAGVSPGASDPGGIPGGRPPGLALRWAAMIQRRPLIAAVVSAGLMLALAAPALGMQLSFPDESAQARGTMGYASYATMARGFGPGFDAPLIIAATLPPTPASAAPASAAPASTASASTARLVAAIGATPGVAQVTPAVLEPGRAGRHDDRLPDHR